MATYRDTELRCWCDLSAFRPHPRTEHPAVARAAGVTRSRINQIMRNRNEEEQR